MNNEIKWGKGEVYAYKRTPPSDRETASRDDLCQSHNNANKGVAWG